MDSLLLGSFLQIVCFISGTLGLGFKNYSVEKSFVDCLLEKTTKYTPDGQMLNNTVYIYIDLYQLLGIDEKEGIVTAKMWIYLMYNLEHLAWNPSMHEDVSSVILPAKTFWTPDVVFYDAAKVVYDGFEEQQVFYSGIVIAKSAGMTLRLTCVFNVKLFPFDTQVRFF